MNESQFPGCREGSAVRAGLRPDSDVDIAVLPKRGVPLSTRQRADLAVDLEEIVGRPVDLGILKTSNLVYAKEAVAHGKLLFEHDRIARARFAMLTLSMYVDLQQNRREVLNAYAA
jgi:uncharacterized protein